MKIHFKKEFQIHATILKVLSISRYSIETQNIRIDRRPNDSTVSLRLHLKADFEKRRRLYVASIVSSPRVSSFSFLVFLSRS